jgi:hypothetical protein
MSKFLAKTAGSLNQHNVLYAKDIKSLLQVGMVTEKYLTPVFCQKFWSSPNVSSSDIVQAFQHKFTPLRRGDKFDAVEHLLQPLKVEIEYSTKELEGFHDSWMSEWYEIGKDMAEWSFPRWMWEKQLIKRFENNMERKIAFKGQFVKPTDGVAGFTMNSCDGLAVSLLQGIYKGATVPFQMGDIAHGDEVAYFEDFCSRIPEEYQDLEMPIFCDPALVKRYYFNRRDRFGSNTDYKPLAQQSIETYAKLLTPLPSMSGTGLFFATPQSNLVKGMKKGMPPMPNIRWYSEDVGRTLKGAAEFERFYGPAFHEEVFLPDTFLKLPNMLPAMPQAA